MQLYQHRAYDTDSVSQRKQPGHSHRGVDVDLSALAVLRRAFTGMLCRGTGRIWNASVDRDGNENSM
jgi:hypothetical protein